jgi:hypothetical protein
MNARRKLKIAYLNGSLLMAAFAGIVSQSWIAFILVLAGGVLIALVIGNIRPSRQP